MIFDLHTHTKRSFDAFTSEKELLRACKIKGIDVIGLTEHDRHAKVDFDYFKKNGIIALSGCEFTTDKGVHIIGFFVNSKKVDIKPRTKEEILNYIKYLDGIAVMPHPLKKNTGYLSVYGEDGNIKDFDFIELVNGGDFKSSGSLYLKEIANRYKLKTLSSSDSHSAEQIGMCVTELDIEINVMTDIQVLDILKTIDQNKIKLMIDSSINIKQRDTPHYKRLMVYQLILKIFPIRLRRILKIFINALAYSKLNIRSPSWIDIREFADLPRNK
jgi:predicted metal-dependent phosphoesterase TrpH